MSGTTSRRQGPVAAPHTAARTNTSEHVPTDAHTDAPTDAAFSLLVAPRPDFDVISSRRTDELRQEGILTRHEEVRVLRRYDVTPVAGAPESDRGSRAAPTAVVAALVDPAEELIVADPTAVFSSLQGDASPGTTPPETAPPGASSPEVSFPGTSASHAFVVVAVRYHAEQFDQRADAAEQVARVLGVDCAVRVTEITVARLATTDQDVLAARRADLRTRLVNPVDSELAPDLVPELVGGILPEAGEPDQLNQQDRAGQAHPADGAHPADEAHGAGRTDAAHGASVASPTESPNEPPVSLDAEAAETSEAPAVGDLAVTGLNAADCAYVEAYFTRQGRAPTETELAVIDTYWSDHCRHTTFRTELTDIAIDNVAEPTTDEPTTTGPATTGPTATEGTAAETSLATQSPASHHVASRAAGSHDVATEAAALQAAIRESWQWYLDQRARRGETDRPVTLMDLATAMMRWRAADGTLADVVLSEEINACTVRISRDTPGLADAFPDDQAWLVLFKNETHNHPTEIEPYGGAATCLGGAIRDPLSGRAYVYQAMRITGSADPRQSPIHRGRGEASATLQSLIGTPEPAVLGGEVPGGETQRGEVRSGTARPGTADTAAAEATAAAGDMRPVGSPTIPGKLPQRLITTGAARGYSSYGNQIGIATGLVDELYHPGYQAKRLEMGAVVGAVPERHVRRERPAVGDIVLLIGGKTGRDGIGGATGSSKSHSHDSLERAGAEVQKGNPPVERALQRLFRDPRFTTLVKRSNDFGAGGVAVAVGEIADGLDIDLDAVPLKYAGLTPTEIAISESQERMAVVVAPADRSRVIALALEENLAAVAIARVTAEPRLVMRSRGRTVVDLDRAFLDSAGVRGTTRARIPAPAPAPAADGGSFAGGSRDASGALLDRLTARLGDLRYASRLGLGEWFDASIGAGTIMAYAAGRLQRSPVSAMAARLPHSFAPGDASPSTASVVPDVATVMAYGFDPDLSAASPWAGAYTAVVESYARLIAAGVAPGAAWLSLQEYFPRPGDDPERWGLPAGALLGALAAQRDLGLTAIGGKDSMSGTFESLDVPPTLISVALGVCPADRVISAHIAAPDAPVYLLPASPTRAGVPDAAKLLAVHTRLHALQQRGVVQAAAAVRGAGWLAAAVQMCFGENMGLEIDKLSGRPDPFAPAYGAVIVQIDPEAGEGAEDIHAVEEELGAMGALRIATTRADGVVRHGEALRRTADLFRTWSAPLEEVFPTRVPEAPSTAAEATGSPAPTDPAVEAIALLNDAFADMPREPARAFGGLRLAAPRVVIPVFPGTNCEDDSAAAFAAVGAVPEIVVVRTSTRDALEESLAHLAERLRESHILMVSGGFSAGDEPAGSGKYIAAVLRSPRVREVIETHFINGPGLILGICNGFQALVRTGLVPFGRFVERGPGWPALAPNTIGRHVSRSVLTRVDSSLGPWMALNQPDELISVPVSHGEGRIVMDEAILAELERRGQVAARYVDWQGRLRLDRPWNPNGSVGAVEALLSPDGRFLGKMGHTERERPGLNRHLPSVGTFRIFEAGARWFA